MLAQSTPLHVVSEVLGQASIAIAKDVYGHLVEGDKRASTCARSLRRTWAGPSRRDPGSALPHRCRAWRAEALLDGDQVPRG